MLQEAMQNYRYAHAKKFRAHLIRLVKAAGQTLIDHAEELVAQKPGTTDFQFIVHFPQTPDAINLPTIEVKHTFVSDEALAVEYEWPDAYGDMGKEENA